jgi:hypothetical protein
LQARALNKPDTMIADALGFGSRAV